MQNCTQNEHKPIVTQQFLNTSYNILWGFSVTTHHFPRNWDYTVCVVYKLILLNLKKLINNKQPDSLQNVSVMVLCVCVCVCVCTHACVYVLEIYHLELAHVITRGESWTAELMLWLFTPSPEAGGDLGPLGGQSGRERTLLLTLHSVQALEGLDEAPTLRRAFSSGAQHSKY